MARTTPPRAGVKAALLAACLCALGVLRPSRHSRAFLVARRSHIVGDQATHGQRSPGTPCRRRASKKGCLEEQGQQDSASPLQLPEANYFTNEAAMHCIEEGCPVEEVEKLYGKLERDEPRIRATIEELEESSEETGAAMSAEMEIEWLQQFLAKSRDMREKLHAVMFSQGFEGAGDITGSLGLGNGHTAGFLRKRPNTLIH